MIEMVCPKCKKIVDSFDYTQEVISEGSVGFDDNGELEFDEENLEGSDEASYFCPECQAEVSYDYILSLKGKKVKK